MENIQKKHNPFTEISIAVLVLVCAALIIVDITTNLINEMDAQSQQVIVVSPAVPTQGSRPTLPPDYTPEPIHDS